MNAMISIATLITTALNYTPSTKYIGVYSFCLFCNYVCLSVNFFFPSKISQQLLWLGF